VSKSAQPNSVTESLQLAIEDVGEDAAERQLLERVRESTGDERKRALAALGELRQITADYDLATDADVCGSIGCRATSQLVKQDGRVLCRVCAVERQRSER